MFTKGTWHAHDGQIYPEETGKTLCLIPYYDKDDVEQEANAKLIAAAPELLEALKNIVETAESPEDDNIWLDKWLLHSCKQAIAKAEN